MPEIALHAPQFLTHLNAQMLVQRRKRFVEQENARLGDRGPRKSDALLLTAGQIGRQTICKFGEPDLLHHGVGGAISLGLGQAANAQREGDVVAHRQMRKQRIGLKHHRGPPFDRRQSDDVLPADHDFPCARILVTRNHRRIVVFPHPEGPRKQQYAPSGILRLTPSTTLAIPS